MAYREPEPSFNDNQEYDPFGEEAHNKFWDKHTPKHSKNKGHFCDEWDGLWICEDCTEFEFCTCFKSCQH